MLKGRDAFRKRIHGSFTRRESVSELLVNLRGRDVECRVAQGMEGRLVSAIKCPGKQREHIAKKRGEERKVGGKGLEPLTPSV